MTGEGHAAEHRGDVDHVAGAAFLEVRQDFLDAVEHRFHVHAHHVVDVRIGELRRRQGDPLPRVVHPDIDVTEARDRLLDDPSHAGAIGDIGGDDERIRPAFAATARSSGSRRAASTTEAPSFAQSSASAAPMPLLAPVITMTLSRMTGPPVVRVSFRAPMRAATLYLRTMSSRGGSDNEIINAALLSAAARGRIAGRVPPQAGAVAGAGRDDGHGVLAGRRSGRW